jgi:hypothetical protein
VVSVLATGPKGRGFTPGRGDGFLRAIKIRSTPSFGWEVKPEVLVVRFYGILKIHCSSDTKLSLLHPFLLLAPDISAGKTARELWRTSQELPLPASSSPWLSILTYHPGDEQ